MTEPIGKLRVFISWSLPLSHEVAKILHRWLPRLIQDVEPWVSSKDIEKGKFWHREIISHLNQSSVGIAIVTPANSERTWLNFEVGALTHALESAGGVVMPLLINMRESDISGAPMSSLQVTRFEKADFFQLIEGVNQRIRHPLGDELLRDEYELRWPSLQREISRAIEVAENADPEHNAKPTAKPQPEILEELVSAVRELRTEVGVRRPSRPGPATVRETLDLRDKAIAAYKMSIGKLDIVNGDLLRDLCENDFNMMRKVVHIQETLERIGDLDAVNMPAVLGFLRRHPRIAAVQDVDGPRPQLVYEPVPERRMTILKLVDDDFLRSQEVLRSNSPNT